MHGGVYNFLKRVAGIEEVAYKNSILASKKKTIFVKFVIPVRALGAY